MLKINRFYVQSEQEYKARRVYYVLDRERRGNHMDHAIAAGDTTSRKTAEDWCEKLNNGQPIKGRYLASQYRREPFMIQKKEIPK